jgi:hypothetical protein
MASFSADTLAPVLPAHQRLWLCFLFTYCCPAGDKIRGCLDAFPRVSLEASLHPITRGVARIQLAITPEFTWRVRGGPAGWGAH